jgi:hypothetical protein
MLSLEVVTDEEVKGNSGRYSQGFLLIEPSVLLIASEIIFDSL